MSTFFKYKNNYTNNNVIHSFENILRMPVSDAFSKSAELNQQYSQIGFPTNAELSASPNAIYVHAYTRDDGTQVRAHWRSRENSGINSEVNLGGNNNAGWQTSEEPIPQYNPPTMDGYVDKYGNIIQRNPDGTEIIIGHQNQLPEVPISQNPDGTYNFDYEDIENPYPNDDSVFKKAPDYPEEESQKTGNVLGQLGDIFTKIIEFAGSIPQLSIDNQIPENIVLDNVNNINFQPISSNTEYTKPILSELVKPNIDINIL